MAALVAACGSDGGEFSWQQLPPLANAPGSPDIDAPGSCWLARTDEERADLLETVGSSDPDVDPEHWDVPVAWVYMGGGFSNSGYTINITGLAVDDDETVLRVRTTDPEELQREADGGLGFLQVITYPGVLVDLPAHADVVRTTGDMELECESGPPPLRDTT